MYIAVTKQLLISRRSFIHKLINNEFIFKVQFEIGINHLNSIRGRAKIIEGERLN